jgi:hypothetical protein
MEKLAYSKIEEHMNELVNMIVTKTGIPQATAQTIVKMVIDFLKKKLPAPVGAQIDGLLSNPGAVQQAEGVVGKVSSLFGKKK